MSLVGALELVRVRVRDLAAARGFYGDTLKLALVAADAAIAVYDTGQAKLVLEQDAAAAPGTIELGFTVASLETALAALVAADVRVVVPPKTEAWGGRTALVADPDGNRLALIQYP